jgi:hypothetical protein
MTAQNIDPRDLELQPVNRHRGGPLALEDGHTESLQVGPLSGADTPCGVTSGDRHALSWRTRDASALVSSSGSMPSSSSRRSTNDSNREIAAARSPATARLRMAERAATSAVESSASALRAVSLDSMTRPSSRSSAGSQPVWSHDGRELFYVSGTREMMVATIDLAGRRVTARKSLFAVPSSIWGIGTLATNYDISPGDQRFLMARPAVAATVEFVPQLIVVQNWIEEVIQAVGR